MNRSYLFLLALLSTLAFPHFAFAQNDLQSNTGVIDVTYICDTINGDDGCFIEGFALIYGDTNSTNLHGLSQTSVSADSFDDGWDGYVVGDVLQDSVEIAGPSQAGDDGQGVSAIIWNAAMNLNATHTFDVRTDSYYNYLGDAGCAGGGTCAYIASTQQSVTLGRPGITSISPPYVFVGTSGTLTLNGNNFVNPFGNPTSITSSKTGGTGFSVSTGTVSNTQASAPYTASLTATTGNWDVGLSYSLGSSILVSTFGSFTVGDPTPTISSISPSTWAAGQVNIPVTIKGSGFGSNPTLVIAGVTSSITGHSDNGQPGGAVITANVSVPGCGTGSPVVTVTSTGYNGTGFVNAYPGQLSYVLATANITPAAALAPSILFNGSNVAGGSPSAVVGQQIALTGQVPTQACTQVQSWSWTPPTGTAVGSATASTGGGFTLGPLPSSSSNPYTFFWPYSGTFTVSAKYTLITGVVSPASTATFKVKGMGGTPLATVNYGHLNDNTLTVCNTTTKETVLAYGNLSGTTCPGGTAGTPGELFTGSGAPGGGPYSFVQLINSDTSTFTSTSGTVTCTHNAGVDNSYPYAAQINATQADDAPYVVLPTSPYNSITRAFSASMYLLWKSSTNSSITIPAGYITWQFSGSTTLTNGKWGGVKGSGTANNFVAASGTQSNKGYPLWTGPSQQTCK